MPKPYVPPTTEQKLLATCRFLLDTVAMADDDLHTPFRTQKPRGTFSPLDAIEAGMLVMVPGGSVTAHHMSHEPWNGEFGSGVGPNGAMRVTLKGVEFVVSKTEDIRSKHQFPSDVLRRIADRDSEAGKRAKAEIDRRTRDLWPDEIGEAWEKVSHVIANSAAHDVERAVENVPTDEMRRVLARLEALKNQVGESFAKEKGGPAPKWDQASLMALEDTIRELGHVSRRADEVANSLRSHAGKVTVALALESEARGDQVRISW